MPSFKRPRIIPIITTLAAFILLTALGTWQVYRLHWKTGILDSIHERIAEEEVTLPLEHYDINALEYRKVQAKGKYVYDKDIFLYMQKEGKSGYNVITPFILGDSSAILVNRGWIPMDMRQTFLDQEKEKSPEVMVDGILQRGETQGMFVPNNNFSKNVWFWLDINDASKISGIHFPPLYIRATGPNLAGEYPLKSDLTIKIRNDHLQYAITWYSLSIAVLVIFALYHKKEKTRTPIKL